MSSRAVLLLGAVCALSAACKSDRAEPAAPVTVVPSITVSPKTVSLTAGQSIDISVTLRGVATGTMFSCSVVPSSAGTVTVLGSICRLTLNASVTPGIRMIAASGALADTVTVVMPAAR